MGQDKYNRLLDYVFVDDVLIQKILDSEGLARIAFINESSTIYLSELQLVQKTAKENKIGIWGIDDYVTEKGFKN